MRRLDTLTLTNYDPTINAPSSVLPPLTPTSPSLTPLTTPPPSFSTPVDSSPSYTTTTVIAVTAFNFCSIICFFLVALRYALRYLFNWKKHGQGRILRRRQTSQESFPDMEAQSSEYTQLYAASRNAGPCYRSVESHAGRYLGDYSSVYNPASTPAFGNTLNFSMQLSLPSSVHSPMPQPRILGPQSSVYHHMNDDQEQDTQHLTGDTQRNSRVSRWVDEGD